MRSSLSPLLTRFLLVAACASATMLPRTTLAQDSKALFDRIEWSNGPGAAMLGTTAEIGVPASCRFTDEKGSKLFMEATQNPPTGKELGVLLCLDATNNERQWFAVFTYDETGYVKDDEKATLDQAAILKTIQNATESGNSLRRKRGWGEIEVLGWRVQPFYDEKTHNLTWSTRLRSKPASGAEELNHSVRLLGRGGVMNADLVADQTQIATAAVTFDSALAEFTFSPGKTYAEWKAGDKIAEYGLTALIAGGAGAVAVKYGLFGKLWKVIIGFLLAAKKLIAIALVAIGASLKKLLGKKEPKAPRAPAKPAGTPSRAFKPVSYKPPPGTVPTTSTPPAGAPTASP